MKSILSLLLLSLSSLLPLGCAGLDSTPSKQELAGEWIYRHSFSNGSSSPRSFINTDILILKKDGTYETSSETKPQTTPDGRAFMTSSTAGVWGIKGDTLVLCQKKVEAGLIPRNPATTIKIPIVAITRDSLLLNWRKKTKAYERIE